MTINKPPFPTDVFDDVITSISCISITDIDDIEGYSSYGLEDITPSCTLGQLNYTYVSRNSQQSGRSPKVVALFSATNFTSNIWELLQLHDIIQIKWNYA